MTGTAYREYGTRHGLKKSQWQYLLSIKNSICPGTVKHAERMVEELEEEERDYALGVGAMMDTHFLNKRFKEKR